MILKKKTKNGAVDILFSSISIEERNVTDMPKIELTII